MKEHNSYDDDYDFGDDDDFFNDLDNDGLKGEKDTTGSLIVLVMVVIGVFSISLAIYDVLRGETAVKDVEQSKTNEERYGF